MSVIWDSSVTCEDEALDFIRKPPLRDVHQNLSKHIFRLLVVDYDRREQPEPDPYSRIVQTAQETLWIDEHFLSLFNQGTSGSEVVEENGRFGFIVQSPSDDDNPYFSFALSSSHAPGYNRERDWTCLYFGSPQLNHEELKDLLEDMKYPDPDLLPPDFMILPTTMLLWQVDRIASAVTELKRELMKLDDKDTNEESKDLRSFGQELSKIRKLHYRTQLRHAFALDFALNLARCFDSIEKSHCVESETQSKYPHVLRRIVQSQKDVLGNIGRNLDNLPLRIEAQQSMMISTHSYYVTDAARRDGTAMSTIAIVTLVFLPGTFVAVS
ncbi:hypothetical protein CC86DRAFT_296005 [Ophiobolus disseminans]|uniref:Uncharacterized protein n=1 Tax=Ophiobolus disseminans TaxID=1469910 RepID=A0A6A6ZUV1_9PLEO|nr:hypothetical protein CC86DRAFT_296005 [Ophiobolus disseminans]